MHLQSHIFADAPWLCIGTIGRLAVARAGQIRSRSANLHGRAILNVLFRAFVRAQMHASGYPPTLV